jgi:hypothetical protein
MSVCRNEEKVREVWGSNLDLETGYTDRLFVVLSPFGQMAEQYLKFGYGHFLPHFIPIFFITAYPVVGSVRSARLNGKSKKLCIDCELERSSALSVLADLYIHFETNTASLQFRLSRLLAQGLCLLYWNEVML